MSKEIEVLREKIADAIYNREFKREFTKGGYPLQETGLSKCESTVLYKKEIDQIFQAFKESGYVKLAEDQSLPEYPASLRISLYAEDVQQDMLKKNFWRIQELEG